MELRSSTVMAVMGSGGFGLALGGLRKVLWIGQNRQFCFRRGLA